MSYVLIVDGARTPMGGLLGDLADATANELGTTAIAATLERAGVAPEAVDEVFMGCVLPAGLKQCPARQAMLAAGIPSTTGAVTINKACGSGMQATIFGIDSIAAGTNQLVVSGGLESMSNAPQILMTGRKGQRLGHTKLFDHMFIDGLEDAYTGAAMGTFAQKTADAHNLTREDMDAFAIESLTRAQRAIDEGLNVKEIAPVTIHTRRGEHTCRWTSSHTRPTSRKFRSYVRRLPKAAPLRQLIPALSLMAPAPCCLLAKMPRQAMASSRVPASWRMPETAWHLRISRSPPSARQNRFWPKQAGLLLTSICGRSMKLSLWSPC